MHRYISPLQLREFPGASKLQRRYIHESIKRSAPHQLMQGQGNKFLLSRPSRPSTAQPSPLQTISPDRKECAPPYYYIYNVYFAVRVRETERESERLLYEARVYIVSVQCEFPLRSFTGARNCRLFRGLIFARGDITESL